MAMAATTIANCGLNPRPRFSEGSMHHRASELLQGEHDGFSLHRSCYRHALCLALPQRRRATFLGSSDSIDLEMDFVKRQKRFAYRRKSAKCRASRQTFRPRRYLLTRNESAFFRVLVSVLDDRCLVSCKVRLADIITCSEGAWRLGNANRIAQKHVDFVISDASTSRIRAAIELDDRSHQAPKRRQRDAFVNSLFRAMRIQLIRIPARWQYDPENVAFELAQAGFTVADRFINSPR